MSASNNGTYTKIGKFSSLGWKLTIGKQSAWTGVHYK